MLLVFALAAGRAWGQNTVSATVTGFENNKGSCRACLYNSAEAFNGNGAAVQCVQAGISGNKAFISFTNVAAGTYAISVFHDANNNNKFDTNFLGIPKEGYGASKNDLPFASAPRFPANKFEVKDKVSTNLSIKLRYLF